MVWLIRTAHMLDFVIFDWKTQLLALMEWGSCLQHLPCSSCFTISLFIISGRILFGVNIFGCIYCTWWWRPYCKMMDHWSWKLITSLIYCRAALKSFNSAWCEIATFFMFRQLVLEHTEQNTQNVSHMHRFLIWFGFYLSIYLSPYTYICCYCLLLLGEKVYRCPLSSDYTPAETASLGFHLDRYHFTHWQKNRDLSSPLQPSSSSRSSSPGAKLGPRSSEGWSPAPGQFLNLETNSEKALLVNKPSDLTDKDAGVENSLPGQTRKSQYEPLDLSVRPESVPYHPAMSPAVLMQMSGLFSNGLSSSITRRLQSFSNAPTELSMKPTYQCDLLVQGSKEEMNSQNAGSIGHDGEGEFEKSEQARDDKNDDAAKWKMLKNDALESQEQGQAAADLDGVGETSKNKLGQWGRAVAESPISLTTGQGDPLQHQGALLSFLRSQGNLNSTPASAHKARLNGGGSIEKDGASGEDKLLHHTQWMQLLLLSGCSERCL